MRESDDVINRLAVRGEGGEKRKEKKVRWLDIEC
jgi:hypothetical protein